MLYFHKYIPSKQNNIFLIQFTFMIDGTIEELLIGAHNNGHNRHSWSGWTIVAAPWQKLLIRDFFSSSHILNNQRSCISPGFESLHLSTNGLKFISTKHNIYLLLFTFY